MTELNSGTGILLSDSRDIRKEMNSFYQDLFAEEEVDMEAQNWLLDQLSMSLNGQEQTSCEGLLTVEECREALNGMNTGRSPGIDGLMAEFYLAFWAVIGEDLVEVLNYGFQNGQLSVSQHRGEFWRAQLKLDKFRKHWSIGEAFCRVDRLDHLVFLFPRSAVT